MRKLPKPTFSPETVFLACISNIEDAEFKARLEDCKQEIIRASQEFEDKAAQCELHTINRHNSVAGIVSCDDMKKIYNTKMAKDGQPGREYYMKIRTASPQNTCPLCGHRKVRTLDHFLPKATFPTLAVTPVNLIPSCFECNFDKRATQPASAKEVTIHPYFDDFFVTDRWLYAEVEQTTPVSLSYFVSPPEHWEETKQARIRQHFKVYNLATLYGSHAGSELASIAYLLEQAAEDGPDGVRNELKKQASSRHRAHLNSWDAVLYSALSESEWFCSVGFSLLKSSIH
ncbi:hypothetical protein E8L90_04775 [Brevibacillus antibioticus]|uniref:HNH endonuclease n=1 Tax=Brevibacillus antibioticus TaxID=2570228 RepID=A0A4U2Y2Y9_9BACL|nr:hypothetical protein [Brevibacillus antibioticus]TKI54808.1 hypothetical protein E8L90_04775 [Brevibacillus antibioticus]